MYATLSTYNDRSGGHYSKSCLEANWYEDRCQSVTGNHDGWLVDKVAAPKIRSQEDDLSFGHRGTLTHLSRQARLVSGPRNRVLPQGTLELKFLSNYTVEHGPKSPLREKNRKEDLLNNHNFSESLKDRSIGRREEGFSSCLPRHPDSHQKSYLSTTQKTSFVPPVNGGQEAAGFPTDTSWRHQPLPFPATTYSTGGVYCVRIRAGIASRESFGRSKHFAVYYNATDNKRRFDILNRDGRSVKDTTPGTTFCRTSSAPSGEAQRDQYNRHVNISRKMADDYKLGGLRIFRDG